MDVEGLKGQRYPLGFTFSFPCYQEGLASARLVRWTKGFKCSGVEGEDVVQLLTDAINRRGVRVVGVPGGGGFGGWWGEFSVVNRVK